MATTTKKITQLLPANVLAVLNKQDIPIYAINTESEEIIKVSDTVSARELVRMTKDTKYLFFYYTVTTTND